jgi:TonB family protein
MNATGVRNDWVGRVVDERFTLLQWLGGSAWGDVFLTELPGPPGHKAAIKLIPAEATGAEARVAGWAATTALSHPHLMQLFHTGRCQINTIRLLYAVMEYAEEDLSQIIPGRPLTDSEAREMLVPVLGVLSYLHEKGFVHGHLKPSNVMVVDNQVKISGDSIHIAGEPGRQFPAPAVYDAPEVVTGRVSPAADVWSLGVTLCEALAQHPPVWDRSTAAQPIVARSVPQPFADIAQECLRIEPTRRCTLSDIKARLELVAPVPGPTSKTNGTVIAKRGRLALGVAALILLAAVATVTLRSRTSSSPTMEEQYPAPSTSRTPQASTQETQTAKGGTVKGAIAERVLPRVAPSARQTIQGKIRVIVRVQVDPNGGVSNARLDSPGPSKYFANLALQAAQRWKFKPAQVDGHAIASTWILRFRFGRTTTEVSPFEATPPA